jgi:orotidine-5'-phosphate decarboxylase
MHGIALVTVPSDLGPAGLQKIVAGTAFKVLAVTVLTSMTGEDLLALGYEEPYARDPARLVVRKAKMAQTAGCHGVVCSGRDVQAVKAACGPDFLAVCPGIRPAWAAVPGDDQKRIVTPQEAITNGADYIVVGRPIRQAENPVAAARRVVEEIALATKA